MIDKTIADLTNRLKLLEQKNQNIKRSLIGAAVCGIECSRLEPRRRRRTCRFASVEYSRIGRRRETK